MVRIQMMGNYLVELDDGRVEDPVSRSRKGAALMAFLILNRGKKVPNQRLIHALWHGSQYANPANALKTLVSRTRAMLEDMCQGLGECLASDRGAYYWRPAAGVEIDLLEIMDILDALEADRDPARARDMHRRLLDLYRGDLFQTGDLDGEVAYAEQLHSQYIKAVYQYVRMLEEGEEYSAMAQVCRRALEVDAFDDRLHIEMMKAMVRLNRETEAAQQYRRAAALSYRYLDAEPSEELRDFYEKVKQARGSVSFNLDVIRSELGDDGGAKGAFVCDYPLFRSLYHLQMRSRDRASGHMYLAAVLLGRVKGSEADEMTDALVEVCRTHLRRGDIVSRMKTPIVLLMMSFPDSATGEMVLERIGHLFYEKYPQSGALIQHRLGALSEETE